MWIKVLVRDLRHIFFFTFRETILYLSVYLLSIIILVPVVSEHQIRIELETHELS